MSRPKAGFLWSVIVNQSIFMENYMSIYRSYPIRELHSEQIDAIHGLVFNGKIKYEYIKCIICGASKYKILFKNDCYGINQQTVMCENCGLIYSNPRMSEESAKYFYESDTYRKIYGGVMKLDRFKSDFERNYKIDMNKPNFEKYYPELFFNFINFHDISYNNVCEIGAGGGWNLLPFISIGKKVIGYEPSPLLCKLGRDTKNINMVNGFVNDIKGEYDLVILKHVLEHFHNPICILSNLRDNIKTYLFIEVPGCISMIPKIQIAHNYYFSLNTLEAITSKAGFKKITMDYCRGNDYIFGLFEKTDIDVKNNYSASDEIKRTLRIYKWNQFRFLLSQFLKASRLYPLAKYLKTVLLPTKN